MSYDFNDANEQRDFGELIPTKTYAKVALDIRIPSGADVGDLPEFTRSKPPSTAQYLNCEFKIISEPLAGCMFWQNIMIAGVSDKALNISKATLRAILESSRGILPSDMSELALKGRQISSFSEFQGLEFVVRIDIENGKNGYNNKNKIGIVITPDKPEYKSVIYGKTIVGQEKPPSKNQSANRQTGNSTQQQQQQQQQQQWPVNSSSNNNQMPQQDTVPSWAK